MRPHFAAIDAFIEPRARLSLPRVNAYRAGLQRSMIIKIDKTRSGVRKYLNRPSAAVIIVGDLPRDIPYLTTSVSFVIVNAAYAMT